MTEPLRADRNEDAQTRGVHARLRGFESAINEAVASGQLEVAKELMHEMSRQMISQDTRILEPRTKIGREGMPDAMRSVMRGQSDAGQIMAGIGSAPALAGHGVAGILQSGENLANGRIPLVGENNNTAEDWKALRGSTPAAQVGNAAGNALLFGAMPTRMGGQVVAPIVGKAGLTAALGSRPAQVLDTMLTQGAVGAATTPGNWEERANAGMISGAVAGVPSSILAAGQGTRRKLTQAGRDLKLAEEIRSDLGPRDAESLIGDLSKANSSYIGAPYGVRPSAGMATQNPTLQTWEVGSRTRAGDLWTPLDRTNATARWDALNEAADPVALAAARTNRESVTAPLRAEAMNVGNLTNAMSNSAGTPEGVLTPLRQRLNALRTGEFAHDPNVQSMVSWLEKNIENATPEQLYHARKLMTDAIPQGPADQLGQSLKAARPQRIELVGILDDALNTITGGHYGDYMSAYRRLSPEISSRTAVQRIVESLRGGAPEGIVPDTMGVAPGFRGVERATQREGSRQFGAQTFDQLLPEHRRLLESLSLDLRAQAAGMKGQAIIGSATAPNAAAAGRGSDAIGRVVRGAVGGAVGGPAGIAATQGTDAIFAALNRASEQQLAQLLQNPQVLAEALRKAAAAEKLTTGIGRAGSASGQTARDFFTQR